MIDKKELARLAELSKLEISPEEADKLLSQLNSAVDNLFSQLSKTDVSGVLVKREIKEVAELREDVAIPSLPPDEFLRGAPSVKRGGAAVPKMLEEKE